jgi:hypothetical protein
MKTDSNIEEHSFSEAEQRLEGLARRLGQDAFEKAKQQASEVVASEKLRREKFNLSEITSLQARYDSLFRRRSELLEVLRLAPLDNPSSLLHKRWYYRIFAFTLIVAGIFFAHLALAPFGLGWEAWIVCLGIGWVAAFWTEQTLEKINCGRFLKCVCVLALLASLGGIFVMALLRGDILALYLKNAVEVTSASADVGTVFYTSAIWKLQLLMALLAVAMELGSGMAMFEAGKLDVACYERAIRARKELAPIEAEMGDVIGRVTHLQNDHIINEAEFWRNFHLGLLERTKRNGLLHFLLLFALLGGFGSNVSATAKTLTASSATVPVTSFVIALDLTQSVAGKGYDGKTDYEKNVDAACQLIAQLPPGARFTVLAITDRSFAQPYILLQRALPSDKGPLQFQDRIALAKAHAASELHKLALSSPHSIPHTDVFGALILAADILSQAPQRKVLVVFSDMRQSTTDLDLERATSTPQGPALMSIEKRRLVAQLQGVNVYVLGVDGAGKSLLYWNGLRDFWESYFRKAGANLKSYSALRHASTLDGE